MRVDARRNRDRLVAAATAVIAEHGPAASLNEIAQRAGVGAGTLYRHFPTRASLLLEVFTTRIEALCARARELAQSRSPGDALTAWLEAFLQHCLTDRGLAETIMKVPPGSDLDCAAKLRTAGAGLVARAQEAGVVRTGLEVEDVLQLTIGIALAADGPGRAERLLSLAVAGLRA
ncbi:TetR/AcrR family transcriptional regulator [Salinispora arenicola]|uniref:Transcriptional regulator n=1 Tax=Salinispora arenicola TaxID=168697 RepID=A0A542XMB7_SALAC|nr:TetR/AcrR family transcriptional regulator [Salinispora arenicola]MCN0153183.1 TetR/AcrR family transcriptional regulator [Salinispora arenicola]TQL36991.1 TetR family transcriptional regulator [Salinispora arenicola]GIM81869.1 transcriptional regulator [Salinispora arenicola]